MTYLATLAAVRARLLAVVSPRTLPLLDDDNVVAHAAAHPAGFRTWTLTIGRARVGARSPSGHSLVGPATVELRVYIPQGIGVGPAVAELDALADGTYGVRVGDLTLGAVSGPYLGRDADPETPDGFFCAGLNLDPELIRTVSTAAA